MKWRIGYSEFLGWLDFFRWEENHHTKLDYYLAALTTEVVRGRAANPRDVKMENYLLKFTSSPLPEDVKQRMEQSKAAWAGALGVDLHRN